ncbi:GNAT family protein [Desulfovibrio sp.]|uniref:GNAT family N-acetyltransferase n=1 Tax=Desulfovibrio sp. TaxID=885 RepID=UPI0025BDCDC8|nr:GNAT family protein [Desulfovibrio sp.]
MRFRYEPLRGPSLRAGQDAIFSRMQAEGLLGCAMSTLSAPTREAWRRITSPRHGLLLCCYTQAATKKENAVSPQGCSAHADAETFITCRKTRSALAADPALRAAPRQEDMLGCALFTPRRGKVWEFDFTTFRAGAPFAVPLAHGGLSWAFARLGCAAIVGLCPAPNRHAWRLAEACGFKIMGRLPQSCWHARKKRHVDGVLVLCTPSALANSIAIAKEAAMGFGGGYSAPSIPDVPPAPKQEVQKPVTEAATAARQAQKNRAAKAAGINGAVHTSPLNRAEDARKTLLGQ